MGILSGDNIVLTVAMVLLVKDNLQGTTTTIPTSAAKQ